MVIKYCHNHLVSTIGLIAYVHYHSLRYVSHACDYSLHVQCEFSIQYCLIFRFQVITKDGMLLIKCQHDNEHFRQKCYAACRILLDISQQVLTMDSFIEVFSSKFNEMLSERAVESMNHAIEVSSTESMLRVNGFCS